MLKLEDIKPGSLIAGLEPGQVVRVAFTEQSGDTINVYYKIGDGPMRERVLLRSDEANLSFAETGLPWSFDAPGEEFKLAAEAYRISLAHLFDPMMAVHTSNVEPLPHQITAVYEKMLPRQPLRFVLADDPGAGKTIMAGLYIRELLMRADARRVLIVAPGSLVEQWQDEMCEKFGLDFKIFARDLVEQARSGNPFEENDLLIARIDQLSRSAELQAKLEHVRWDLVIVDEAHKMSATWSGQKLSETKRYKLGKLLSQTTRHFLLMTATPHNGKEEDFQLFMALLDAERFYGRFREGATKVDVSDVMRRMVKEELLKFDGTPLFPERRAYTVNYKLSLQEADLYQAVTAYVKEEMNKADRLEDAGRRGTVGFALTGLQRRLASSPAAIYHSLRRRHERLKKRVEEEKANQRGPLSPLGPGEIAGAEDIWDADEDLPAADYETVEEDVVDRATASRTIQELEAEIRSLEDLVERAREVLLSDHDRKWDELSKLLQNTPEMRDPDGRQRKLIVFTEHRDTLKYLAQKIADLLGVPEAVVQIHGGMKREDRRFAQERFRNDPAARVLVATDAAGEGVNLQNANLMVNYDLPWNPNRIEQRFGRIHRIGQTEVCHLWNMVASETREGDVFQRLFDKLEAERKALGGRVFNILGDVFDERSLRDLLIEAIRYGEDPAVRERLYRTVEGALDTQHLEEILRRNALSPEIIDEKRLFAIKEEMEKAEARKLQPYFVRSFFVQAFRRFGGDLREREPGRYEITYVPAVIREHNRSRAGVDRRSNSPVLRAYERICFEKQYMRLRDRIGAPLASLIHPGHPLMQAVTGLISDQYGDRLSRGAVLVDPNDRGVEPKLLFIIDHAIKEGSDPSRAASRRLQFVAIDQSGRAVRAGWAPHLDLEPIATEDLALVRDILSAPWIKQDLEQVALAYAAAHLVPEHYAEVQARRVEQVERIMKAVNDRLVKEINYQSNLYVHYDEQLRAGKDVRLLRDNARRTVDELTARRDARLRELEAQKNVFPAPPTIIGAALVIPEGLLRQRAGQPGWSANPEARARVERIAMDAVMAAEQQLGNEVIDVSAEKCGWDITSIPKVTTGVIPPARHIEVKGRVKGESTITVTKNEILSGLNQGDKFILAVVIVDGESYEGPYYIRKPFAQEPDWAVASINLDLAQLLARAEKPTEAERRGN